MAHDEDLRRQVERLERRLARLETLLDVEGTEPAAEAPAHEQTFEHQPLPAPSVIPPLVPPRLIPASIPPLVEQPVDENTPAPRPPAPPTTAPPSVPAEEPLAPEPVVHAPRVVQAPPVTPPPVVPAPPAAPPVRRRPAAKGRDPLELLVGGKWMAWFGAFAVVIGVGFFLKYAYDQAWYLRLSETAALSRRSGLRRRPHPVRRAGAAAYQQARVRGLLRGRPFDAVSRGVGGVRTL